MKKIILIAAVLLVAIVGLTSYNGKEERKNTGDDKLLAMIKTSKTGEPQKTDFPKAGDKKLD